MDGLAKAIETKAAKRLKPVVSVGVSVDTRTPYPGEKNPPDWRREEHQRLSAEVAALEKELKDFEPKSAAEKIRRGLEIKLKLKRLRLEECKLKLDGYGPIDTD